MFSVYLCCISTCREHICRVYKSNYISYHSIVLETRSLVKQWEGNIIMVRLPLSIDYVTDKLLTRPVHVLTYTHTYVPTYIPTQVIVGLSP